MTFFFCSTFTFQGLRIDEALRLYLEAFRLPGEAPVIQRLLETFTDNWHVRHISLTSENRLNNSLLPCVSSILIFILMENKFSSTTFQSCGPDCYTLDLSQT